MSSKSNTVDRLIRRIRTLAIQYSLVLRMPAAWVKSISSARTLTAGKSSRYMGFRPKNALNCLFYRTQWLNIRRYGRDGNSPIVGLGKYPLSRWFHISAMSHRIYAHAGAATMLGGTLIWVFMHLVWIMAADWWWVLLITSTLLLSVTSYSMAFVRQNYNVLGWLWMPVALFAVTLEQWAIAAIAWFAASLSSITVIFVAVPLMLAQSILTNSVDPILVLVPAVAKVGLHGLALVRNGTFKESLLILARIIGLLPTKIRYQRASRNFGRFNLYFSLLYISACLLSWFVNAAVPWLPLCAAFIFVVNQKYIRFADDQSVIILFVTVFAAHTLAIAPGLPNFLLLFAVVNPLPYLLGIVERNQDDGSLGVTVYKPFDHTRIEQDCDTMFERAPEGSRILFAFDDPGGAYERLFDGYRNAIELPLYVAARRKIHLFPDWHAVGETNTTGDFHIWGRSLTGVCANVSHWSADFVLYYLPSENDLPIEWLSKFEVVDCFDFASHLGDFAQALPWSTELPCPKFLLLRPLPE